MDRAAKYAYFAGKESYWTPRKLSCVYTENHEKGLDKEVDAGEVSSISQHPELQEPTASSPKSNTVIQLCLGNVSC